MYDFYEKFCLLPPIMCLHAYMIFANAEVRDVILKMLLLPSLMTLERVNHHLHEAVLFFFHHWMLCLAACFFHHPLEFFSSLCHAGAIVLCRFYSTMGYFSHGEFILRIQGFEYLCLAWSFAAGGQFFGLIRICL